MQSIEVYGVELSQNLQELQVQTQHYYLGFYFFSVWWWLWILVETPSYLLGRSWTAKRLQWKNLMYCLNVNKEVEIMQISFNCYLAFQLDFVVFLWETLLNNILQHA
jgi:hypothetical protein